MQLHHTGYIVTNAEDPTLIQEGMQLVVSVIDPLQQAKICLYKNLQNELIELVEPLNEKSPVWNFLKKKSRLNVSSGRENGFHHECFTATIDEIEKYTLERRLTKIMGPVPAKIFNDQQILFFIAKDSKITEFIL